VRGTDLPSGKDDSTNSVILKEIARTISARAGAGNFRSNLLNRPTAPAAHSHSPARLAVREQDAVADRSDQDVDRFVDRKCGLAARQSAALESLQMLGRVSATARGEGAPEVKIPVQHLVYVALSGLLAHLERVLTSANHDKATQGNTMAGTSLPYLHSPGSLKTALERIRAATTPERVTLDFVNNTLQIKGGTGSALIPFFKKIGLVSSDGTPTELYKRVRNPSLGGTAIAEAIKSGYAPLRQVNESFYDLPEKDLNNLILQVTGLAHDNQVAKLTCSTLKSLKAFADFKTPLAEEVLIPKESVSIAIPSSGGPATRFETQRLGLNLAYTINLNLPATPDQAVFNAIFKALKEHLISNEQ
jgi:hypothetical protein